MTDVALVTCMYHQWSLICSAQHVGLTQRYSGFPRQYLRTLFIIQFLSDPGGRTALQSSKSNQHNVHRIAGNHGWRLEAEAQPVHTGSEERQPSPWLPTKDGLDILRVVKEVWKRPPNLLLLCCAITTVPFLTITESWQKLITLLRDKSAAWPWSGMST